MTTYPQYQKYPNYIAPAFNNFDYFGLINILTIIFFAFFCTAHINFNRDFNENKILDFLKTNEI